MNSWKIGLSAVAVTFLACAGVSAAELDGTWKPPPIGTKVTYDTNDSATEVVKVDGNYVYFKRKGESASPWCMGLQGTKTGDGREWRFDCDSIAALFPLKVGNKATFSMNLPGWSGRKTFLVSSVKEIETAIGSRAVFLIKYRLAGIHGGYIENGLMYFDPALGTHVSGRYKVVKGGSGEGGWKITELELPE